MVTCPEVFNPQPRIVLPSPSAGSAQICTAERTAEETVRLVKRGKVMVKRCSWKPMNRDGEKQSCARRRTHRPRLSSHLTRIAVAPHQLCRSAPTAHLLEWVRRNLGLERRKSRQLETAASIEAVMVPNQAFSRDSPRALSSSMLHLKAWRQHAICILAPSHHQLEI